MVSVIPPRIFYLHARHAVTPAFDVSVVDCSGDFGKNMTQLDLPDDERVESLTAAVVGLWVAIHTVNITSDQHEVRFFIFCRFLNCASFTQPGVCLQPLPKLRELTRS